MLLIISILFDIFMTQGFRKDLVRFFSIQVQGNFKWPDFHEIHVHLHPSKNTKADS